MAKDYWGDITAIGSLPDIGTGPGVEMVLNSLERIPHWPQFPRRKQEYFTHQFLQVLIDCGLMEIPEKGNPVMDSSSRGFTEGLTRFYRLYLEAEAGSMEALDAFAVPEWAGEGFYALLKRLDEKSIQPAYVKGQLVGPLTAGLQVMDNRDVPVFYDDQLRDLIIKGLEMNIHWQVRQLSRTGRPVMIFLDEGLLHAWGHREFLGLDREFITTAFAVLVAAIKKSGAVAGIHFCSRADWDLLFPARPDILAFDAYTYFPGMLAAAEGVNRFLEEDGTIAWGIVPVYQACFQESPRSLLARRQDFIQRLEQKGVDKNRLIRQSMITPSCGTGFYPPEIAGRVYSLLQETGLLNLLDPPDN